MSILRGTATRHLSRNGRPGTFAMRAVDIIRRQRDGAELTRSEIEAFARAAADGSWPDYQLSALLMAIFLNGMSPTETATLTGAMVITGTRYHWDDVPG